ncbi:hypothetical protein DINM_020786 [Dirofilaria immitis]|nr:hypothetical protein [Dirofilaria immitis]
MLPSWLHSIPYRTSTNNLPIGSFPPNVYYRDTYGLQHLIDGYGIARNHADSITTVESDDTVTTKSTVRTIANIHNVSQMNESSTSKGTVNSPSFHSDDNDDKKKSDGSNNNKNDDNDDSNKNDENDDSDKSDDNDDKNESDDSDNNKSDENDDSNKNDENDESDKSDDNDDRDKSDDNDDNDKSDDNNYSIDQVVTNQVILMQARTLLTLTLVAFAAALQLMIFGIICVFMMAAHIIRPLFQMLCIMFTSISFIIAVTIFIWTAYLIYGEDKQIRGQGWSFYEENFLELNRIVSNTRVAMYSLHMTVLVPIELKQVETFDESEIENASVGVQTSGGNQILRDNNVTRILSNNGPSCRIIKR